MAGFNPKPGGLHLPEHNAYSPPQNTWPWGPNCMRQLVLMLQGRGSAWQGQLAQREGIPESTAPQDTPPIPGNGVMLSRPVEKLPWLNSLAPADIPVPYQASEKETLHVPLCAVVFLLGRRGEFKRILSCMHMFFRVLEEATKCRARFCPDQVTQAE